MTPGAHARTDWGWIFRRLSRGDPTRLLACRQLTLPEVALLLDGDAEGKHGPRPGPGRPGRVFASHAEKVAWYAWWRSLTPSQKLQKLRDREA